MRCTIIGLGEAGNRYATALVELGHDVTGTDPADTDTPAGVTRVGTIEEAVSSAEMVLVMTSASVAPAICDAALAHLRPDTCYADFTSSAPTVMRQLGDRVAGAGSLFADVAILGPVAWHGARTPLMASGAGAPDVAALLRPAGATVDVLDEPPGSAMAHKLLRSVFMKGLASLVVEAVDAGRAAGYETWIREQISAQLAGDGHAVIDRLLHGTRTHAERRAHEMDDAAGYLADLGVPATMTEAARSTHRRISAASHDGVPGGAAAVARR
jgi:3-hydroxyisobutyrate dehydrogenase-like beta-hydroxyacid dehydrogenase